MAGKNVFMTTNKQIYKLFLRIIKDKQISLAKKPQEPCDFTQQLDIKLKATTELRRQDAQTQQYSDYQRKGVGAGKRKTGSNMWWKI